MLRRSLAAAAAALATLAVAPAAHAAKGGTCESFAVTVNGTTFRGDQKRTIAGPVNSIQVRGTYITFDVTPSGFTTLDYAHTGKASPRPDKNLDHRGRLPGLTRDDGGRMRVISGRHKGRRLQAPPGLATRPTSDRVREALFSILGDRVQGARVLDLFAGSGALGIEALSRGALQATFVDNAAAAIRALEANLRDLDADATVVRAEARRFLGGASRSARQYDLVFVDPPYQLAASLGPELTGPLGRVLAEGAVVIAESDRRVLLALDLPLEDERRYGDTLIRIHGPR